MLMARQNVYHCPTVCCCWWSMVTCHSSCRTNPPMPARRAGRCQPLRASASSWLVALMVVKRSDDGGIEFQRAACASRAGHFIPHGFTRGAKLIAEALMFLHPRNVIHRPAELTELLRGEHDAEVETNDTVDRELQRDIAALVGQVVTLALEGFVKGGR